MAVRSTEQTDDSALAKLLDRAYEGTVDFDPDADHARELATWRRVDGARDDASSVAVIGDSIVGACLIGAELGAPFVYEVAVDDSHRRRGLGRVLLERSLLALSGEPHAAAWITVGNTPSEALFESSGFLPVTPPMLPPEAIACYRAASALGEISLADSVAVAVTVDSAGPILWRLGQHEADRTTMVRNVEVRIRCRHADDPIVTTLAHSGFPLSGAAWLLRQR